MKFYFLLIPFFLITCSFSDEIKFEKNIITPSTTYTKNKRLSNIIEKEYIRKFMSTEEDIFPYGFLKNENIEEVTWKKSNPPKVYYADAFFVSELNFDGKKKLIFRIDNYDVWFSGRYLGEEYKAYITNQFIEEKNVKKTIEEFKKLIEKNSKKNINTKEFKKIFSTLSPYTEDCSYGCAYTKHEYFAFENNYYFLYRKVDTALREKVYDNHTLHRLNKDGTSDEVAEFEVYPKQKDETILPMVSALSSSLYNIYGSRDNAGTTMEYEFRISAYNEIQKQIKNKPWTVVNKRPRRGCENYENDPEPFLESWSYTDNWTLREYQALKYHIKSAEYELENFFKNKYALTPSDAKKSAECSTKSLIQTLIWTPSYSSPYSIDDIDKLKTDFNKTALMYSAHMNNYNKAKKLLANGENINAKTSVAYRSGRKQWNGEAIIYNRTPLMYAAENSSIELIKLLVDKGADISAVDTKERTISCYLKFNPYLSEEDRVLNISELIKKYSDETQLFRPSFNCKNASTKIEKRICRNKSLSIYDRELTSIYLKLKKRSNDSDYEKRDMLAWQKERKDDCSELENEDLDICLIRKYRAKTRYLLQRLKNSPKL